MHQPNAVAAARPALSYVCVKRPALAAQVNFSSTVVCAMQNKGVPCFTDGCSGEVKLALELQSEDTGQTVHR